MIIDLANVASGHGCVPAGINIELKRNLNGVAVVECIRVGQIWMLEFMHPGTKLVVIGRVDDATYYRLRAALNGMERKRYGEREVFSYGAGRKR